MVANVPPHDDITAVAMGTQSRLRASDNIDLADLNDLCIIADSGSDRHIFPRRALPLTTKHVVRKEKTVISTMAGTCISTEVCDLIINDLHLDNCVLVDGDKPVLVSIGQLRKEGYEFSPDLSVMTHPLDGTETHLFIENNILYIDSSNYSLSCFAENYDDYTIRNYTSTTVSKEFLYHARFGHRRKGLSALAKRADTDHTLEGFPSTITEEYKCECAGCLRAKAVQPKHRTKRQSGLSKKPGELIYGDTVAMPPSYTGIKQFVLFIDDHTRMIFVYDLDDKSGKTMVGAFEKMLGEVKRAKHTWKRFRSDRGSEYFNVDVKNWLTKNGIERESSGTQDKRAGGVWERPIRTIWESAHSMLITAKMGVQYWPLAVHNAGDICNILEHSKIKAVPYDLWFAKIGLKPDYRNIYTFGCTVYAYIPSIQGGSDRPSKGERARRLVYVGFSDIAKTSALLMDFQTNTLYTESLITAVIERFDDSGRLLYNGFNEDPDRIHRFFKEEEIIVEENPSPVDFANKIPLQVKVHYDSVEDTENLVVLLGSSDKQSRQRKKKWYNALTAIWSNHSKLWKPIRKLIEDSSFDSKGYCGIYAKCSDPLFGNRDVLVCQHDLSGSKRKEFVVVGPNGEQLETDDLQFQSDDINPKTTMSKKRKRKDTKQTSVNAASSSVKDMNWILSRNPHLTREQIINPILRKDQENKHFTPNGVDEMRALPKGSPCRNAFEIAFATELSSLERLGVYEIVDRPVGRKVVGNRVIFTRRWHADGDARSGFLEKHKCRIVATGYSQIPGVDYFDVFSATPSLAVLRTFLAAAAQLGWDVYNFDVKTAFLNAVLTEEIYMQIPGTRRDHPKVWRLLKALYGLKQSGREWMKTLKAFLIECGFEQNPAEPCLYEQKDRDGKLQILLAVHVDDVVYCGANEIIRKSFLDKVVKRFGIVDKGLLTNIVKIGVDQSVKGQIRIFQRQYIEQLIHDYNLEDIKPKSTPMVEKYALVINERTPEEIEQMKGYDYLRLLGQLLWVSRCTRFDISHAVSLLARANRAPTRKHYSDLIRVLRYLKGTMDSGIVYKRLPLEHPSRNRVTVYADADFARHAGDISSGRKSITGLIVLYNGFLVEYVSKAQPTVALNTCEAEYTALSRGCSEAIFFRTMLSNINMLAEGPSMLYGDNTAAIAIARNDMIHTRVKHLDVKLHFIRDRITMNEVDVEHIDTKGQLADIMTKPLASRQYEMLKALIYDKNI